VSEGRRGGLPTLTFPLTQFIVALIKMTHEQRMKASAEKAAARYGLPVGTCQWWINHYQGVWDNEQQPDRQHHRSFKHG
jgi:hypothetical protein